MNQFSAEFPRAVASSQTLSRPSSSTPQKARRGNRAGFVGQKRIILSHSTPVRWKKCHLDHTDFGECSSLRSPDVDNTIDEKAIHSNSKVTPIQGMLNFFYTVLRVENDQIHIKCYGHVIMNLVIPTYWMSEFRVSARHVD